MADITGDSNVDEYNLRKCITYDLVEYEGDFSVLLESWTKGEKEPEGISDEEDEPAQRAYVRPKMKDGTSINTMSKGAVSIKKAAAVAVAGLIDRIALAHALPDDLPPAIYGGGGGLDAATSMMASVGRSIAETDWSWQELAWAVYLVLLHIALAYTLLQRWGPHISCRRRRAVANVGSQANTLPNVLALTVEGLRAEAKNLGLRTNGRRTELEHRVAKELSSRASDMH